MSSPTVIMPIAGAGSRFAELGEKRPKPIIEIKDVPMAIWALRSVTRSWPHCEIVFVILREHERVWNVTSILSRFVPQAKFCFAEALTGGSLQTCLLTKEIVFSAERGQNESLIILDCDLAFRSTHFVSAVDSMARPATEPSGVLLSFPSQNARYSYAREENGFVAETAEKNVISSNALAGAYAFGQASLFFDEAEKMILKEERVANGEYYTSTVFNHLIAAKKQVVLTRIEKFWSFGTPEELAACLADQEFHAFLNELKI